MKILFVTNNSYLYGANLSMLDLAKELKSNGHKVYIVFNQKGDLEYECKALQIPYYYHPAYWCTGTIPHTCLSKIKNKIKAIRCVITTIFNFGKLVNLIKKEKIEIVHTNNLCSIDGAVASHFANVRHIWHIREFLEEDYGITFILNRWLMGKLFSWTDKFIFISESVSNKYTYLKKMPYEIIHDGVKFDPDFNLIKQKKFVYFFSGLLQENKGIRDAILAFSKAKTTLDNIELWIAGDTSKNTIFKEDLDKFIYNLNLHNCIKFLGYRRDLEKILPTVHCGLVCSKLEGLGRVTVEYMRSRVVVIGANTGGTKEIISHGNTGYLYEYGNTFDLAQKMIYIYKNYATDEIIKVRENAYNYSNSEFSTKNYQIKILKVYSEILQR